MVIVEDDEHVICGPEPLAPLPEITLGKLVYDSLISNSHKREAFVDSETTESISYMEILKKSCSLAEALICCGYGQNTIMTICGENCLEFYIPVIAALYIGAVMAPVNPAYSGPETERALRLTEPRVAFCSPKTAAKFAAARHCAPLERIVLFDASEHIAGTELLSDFLARNRCPSFERPTLPAAFAPMRQTAFVMFSSGTTGMPKGVMLTHANVLVRYMQSMDARFVVPDPAEIGLGIMPFFHAYGLIVNLVSLVRGIKVVVVRRFGERSFLRAIEQHRITRIWLAPPLMVFLAKSRLVEEYELSCLREVSCGAAPLSKEVEALVKRRFNLSLLRQGYGLTEATLAVLMVGVGEERAGSCGKVVTYMRCKVRDPETGRSLGAGHVGELCFKGPMLMKGYYADVAATAHAFTSDGWLLTGDLGYYDDDGYFFIVDRLKELIKYKAHQVPPAELEAVLLTHPAIRDAAVVGVADEAAGELPLAFIVQEPHARLVEEEVQRFVAERVSPQKRLRGGVVFVTEIPKNPSGKILRRELRNMLHKHLNKKCKL